MVQDNQACWVARVNKINFTYPWQSISVNVNVVSQKKKSVNVSISNIVLSLKIGTFMWLWKLVTKPAKGILEGPHIMN
jgi:hypothetical protein